MNKQTKKKKKKKKKKQQQLRIPFNVNMWMDTPGDFADNFRKGEGVGGGVWGQAIL